MSWLPPDLSLGVAATLLAASFVTSFITAAFGIGGGAALLTVLATLLPPAALIPVHGVVQIGSNLGRAAILLRHVLWRIVPPFLAGALIGVAVGGSLATALPPRAVQIAVGLFILWSVFFTPPSLMRRFAWLTGAVSSFLTMFFGATGPFRDRLPQGPVVGPPRAGRHHASLMTAQHLLKTAVFGVLASPSAPWAGLIAGMVGAGFLRHPGGTGGADADRRAALQARARRDPVCWPPG